jgi:hypothetical protein
MQPELELMAEKIRARGFAVSTDGAILSAFGFTDLGDRGVTLRWQSGWQGEFFVIDGAGEPFSLICPRDKEALDAIFHWLREPY